MGSGPNFLILAPANHHHVSGTGALCGVLSVWKCLRAFARAGVAATLGNNHFASKWVAVSQISLVKLQQAAYIGDVSSSFYFSGGGGGMMNRWS